VRPAAAGCRFIRASLLALTSTKAVNPVSKLARGRRQQAGPRNSKAVARMAQTTQRFLQIEAIFHEALAAPDDARTELIEARCSGDRELAAEVRSLLKACQAEERLAACRRLPPDAGQEAQTGRKRVGPYELDRLLARGGMGAVYLAHHADGQFEQKVAIKLIDLPLATDLFRERFRQERQILAEGISFLHSAIRQPGAGAGQSHHHSLGHLLARHSVVSSADSNTTLRTQGTYDGGDAARDLSSTSSPAGANSRHPSTD